METYKINKEKEALIGKLQSEIKSDLQELIASGYDVSEIKELYKKAVKQVLKLETDLNQAREDLEKQDKEWEKSYLYNFVNPNDKDYFLKMVHVANGNLVIVVEESKIEKFKNMLKGKIEVTGSE